MDSELNKIYQGDVLERLKEFPDNCVDSIVTDPPYGIGFMGKEWDTFNPEIIEKGVKRSSRKKPSEDLESREKGSAAMESARYDHGIEASKKYQNWCFKWAKECLRVLKPGGHLLASNSPRMYHRMASAIEDAGFEIRDQIQWIYGSGFPKSLDISKAIDKQAGAERKIIGVNKNGGMSIDKGMTFRDDNWTPESRDLEITEPATPEAKQWDGWGTALKPANEPIVLARKPLSEKSIAKNVLKHGTGGINIDGSRIPLNGDKKVGGFGKAPSGYQMGEIGMSREEYKTDWVDDDRGRWPANLIHDGLIKDWAKFFYVAKASKQDRDEGLDGFEEKPLARSGGAQQALKEGRTEYLAGEHRAGGMNEIVHAKNNHPTVKPTELMRYLVRLVTPPNGVVLDPFMGSGSTGKAAVLEGFNFVGIEREPEYIKIAEARIRAASKQQVLSF